MSFSLVFIINYLKKTKNKRIKWLSKRKNRVKYTYILTRMAKMSNSPADLIWLQPVGTSWRLRVSLTTLFHPSGTSFLDIDGRSFCVPHCCWCFSETSINHVYVIIYLLHTKYIYLSIAVQILFIYYCSNFVWVL